MEKLKTLLAKLQKHEKLFLDRQQHLHLSLGSTIVAIVSLLAVIAGSFVYFCKCQKRRNRRSHNRNRNRTNSLETQEIYTVLTQRFEDRFAVLEEEMQGIRTNSIETQETYTGLTQRFENRFAVLEEEMRGIRNACNAKVAEQRQKIKDLEASVTRLLPRIDFMYEKLDETYERVKEIELRERATNELISNIELCIGANQQKVDDLVEQAALADFYELSQRLEALEASSDSRLERLEVFGRQNCEILESFQVRVENIACEVSENKEEISRQVWQLKTVCADIEDFNIPYVIEKLEQLEANDTDWNAKIEVICKATTEISHNLSLIDERVKESDSTSVYDAATSALNDSFQAFKVALEGHEQERKSSSHFSD